MTAAVHSPLLSPVRHGEFRLERVYKANPARVFGAWADLETKSRWFRGPGGWELFEQSMDFRVGGKEVLHGRHPNGVVTRFTATFHAIQPQACVVYTYDMHHTGVHLSVSLATVEFMPDGTGTRMTFTEQAAFFDGKDGTESRKKGTDIHFDRLAELLESH